MTQTPMTPNLIQEQLSWAYVQAVVSRAGWRLSRPNVDDRGIDGTLLVPTSGINMVDFQLKSTTAYTIQDDTIAYDLRVENYNRLIATDGIPLILILLLMPDEPADWLSEGPDELCLRKCAYWVSLMGQQRSNNASSCRVFLPIANVFHGSSLQAMFSQVRR